MAEPTWNFEVYLFWQFRRQEIFLSRYFGEEECWVQDPILNSFFFTNAYRINDRISQYLIANVQDDSKYGLKETFFRTMLFKLFNKEETWEHWNHIGLSLDPDDFNWRIFERWLPPTPFRGAYLQPFPGDVEGYPRGATAHVRALQMLDWMMKRELYDYIGTDRFPTKKDGYELLKDCPNIGPFLACQFVNDLEFSSHFNFIGGDFVVAGPQAKEGIWQCFQDKSYENWIRVVNSNTMADMFGQGFPWRNLFGRPLGLIDSQSGFCELSKYLSVGYGLQKEIYKPGAKSSGKRRMYSRDHRPIPYQYPAHWDLDMDHWKPRSDDEKKELQKMERQILERYKEGGFTTQVPRPIQHQIS